MFADEDEPTGADPVELEVKENTTGDIGDAIMATDPNNDLMLYSLERRRCGLVRHSREGSR